MISVSLTAGFSSGGGSISTFTYSCIYSNSVCKFYITTLKYTAGTGSPKLVIYGFPPPLNIKYFTFKISSYSSYADYSVYIDTAGNLYPTTITGATQGTVYSDGNQQYSLTE